MKVAINGFGRIGRAVYRILHDHEEIDVVAINDLFDPASLVHMFRYDSVMGRWSRPASLDGDSLKTDRFRSKLLAVKDPKELPWKALGVDYVVESTGVFRKRAQCALHLEAGARKVILTVPAKDEIDATIVYGVNNAQLKPEHKIISNASCTTNCLAPLAYLVDKEFGIERGLMTTVHAYTNDQRLVDMPHSDLRRARAAAMNIIPTTTGAARAVGKVLPHLNGKLDGMSLRVPVPTGSVVDLVATLKRKVTKDEVNAAVKKYADGELKAILSYCTDPIVSIDIAGDPHSCIFDADSTFVVDGNLVKLIAWYDNEWGYSCRVCDLLHLLHKVG
ncbi:MAG TPA: type I glyceraldehyde-3-phosphate dehydrogenase [Candidatus Krumholzibacteria bacterium]|nr:type I glyceraldehyde-3-phosphate dehydrogenase [Candidatus Krumholzibacteria bacterium]HPD72414.1 type I glyceraldehyde-3-phosphate dehydrogenase [Candidatus Krumholzibacteria bacterium]HRY40654.1 type I glyceraldehyde-3-phosphate dehydrogenase [Candidatus Krumholzibacteria bacterium]